MRSLLLEIAGHVLLVVAHWHLGVGVAEMILAHAMLVVLSPFLVRRTK